MPTDLAISSVSPPAPATGRSAPPDTPPRADPAAERVLPNPSLRLEPELGLVVIEFRNDSGTIEASYPSARQLAAYRAHAIGDAPAPATETTSERSAPQPSSGSSASSADKASSR